ncbi:hypothetical protein [Oceanobacter kriegii]|uniref:hypothetical protein n=1 Tax=Oceanobacter kriegii TaxID=64972 RepID=UPI0004205F2A|nr:hypothetical protein [Oceanobacter kriegii]
MKRLLPLAGLLLTGAMPSLAQAELYYEKSGNVSLEARYFADSDADQQQTGMQLSIAAQPKLLWEWNGGDDAVTLEVFKRFLDSDDERNHFDLRDLSWVHVADSFESRIGIRRVFWGVTEFQHLVDVINQTDGVEAPDGEDKLGQPMVNVSLVRDWGIVDVFVLPYFRERTFASEEGRFRPALVVDADHAQYESDDEQKHIDYALRWSHYIGDFDIGLHAFKGTNRDPLLNAELQGSEIVLVPYYAQMTQFGLDLQATIDSWLWKFETIHRNTQPENYWAAQGGLEYTFYGVMDSNADVGVLTEYGWDQRGEDAGVLAQNDVFAGARLTFNDVDDSALLIGGGYDLDYGSTSLVVEGSKRVGESFKLSIDGNLFLADDSDDAVLYSIREDDFVQLTLEYFY